MVSSSGLDTDSPALLTTRSTPPKASTAARSAAATCSSSVTSAATAIATSVGFSAVAPSSPATFSAAAASRSATTTQAPSAASRRAVAAPMPEPPPVTNAMRVASGLGGGMRRSLASSSSQYSMRNFSDSGIGAYADSASAPRITLMALT